MRLITGLLATATLALATSANAAIDFQNVQNPTGYIDAQGREWLPAGEGGLPAGVDPLQAMSAQCNVLTGWCGNQWNSLHWASLSEVAQMVAQVTGQPLPPPGTNILNGAGAAALEADLGYTSNFLGNTYDTGVTRDGYALNVYAQFDFQNPPYAATGAGSYGTFKCVSTCNDPEFTALGWVAVPEPSTLALMVAGVGIVLLARRRAT
jgi:hypothetical protein